MPLNKANQSKPNNNQGKPNHNQSKPSHNQSKPNQTITKANQTITKLNSLHAVVINKKFCKLFTCPWKKNKSISFPLLDIKYFGSPALASNQSSIYDMEYLIPLIAIPSLEVVGKGMVKVTVI